MALQQLASLVSFGQVVLEKILKILKYDQQKP